MDKVGTFLPVLHDKGSVTVDAYRAFALPTLCLLDKQHNISHVWTGSMKNRRDQLVEQIKSVLESDSAFGESEGPAEEPKATE